MQEYVENFLSENSALRRKLQSKTEALLILSKELDQCRTERDEFKLMAEQLQSRYSNLKRKTQDMGMCHASLYLDEEDHLRPGVTVAQLLGETREQNKALRIQMEDLKQRLNDAYGDIKVLRAGNAQNRTNNGSKGEILSLPDHHKEELVQQLETLSAKCSQLHTDLQAVLDEKEDLVSQRDVYKCKVHRLNHELSALLKGGREGFDIDALVMENRYLQERLKHCQEEQETLRRSLQKYKSVLDQKRNKGTVRLGTPSAAAGLVINSTQVKELLDTAGDPHVMNSPAATENLRSICQALFDALEDKGLRLAHQKKANRILAKRVFDLETQLRDSGGNLHLSEYLLDGYCGSQVDRHAEQSTAQEVTDTNINGPNENTIPSSSIYSNTEEVVGVSSNTHTQIYTSPKSGSRSVLSSSSDLEDCLPLPPQVQALVQQALEKLKMGGKEEVLITQN